MAYLLGIDIGTSGTKTLLCDQGGQVIATAMAEHADPAGPHPGWSEQAPDDWWRATCEATRAVLDKAGIEPDTVAGIGLSGQMHGSVFLNSQQQVIRPAILWNDQRTAAQCAQIEQAVGGSAKLIEQVGNPALTGFTAPKILWLRDNEPEHYRQTQKILLPKDYIRFRMTGQFATDVGDASGTLLLDVEKRQWNEQVLKTLDIDPKLLPPCYESHVASAKLSADGAQALGLSAGTPVVGGSGDQPAGAVGNGIVTSGVVSATLGTSGVVFAHADQPTYDPQGRVHTMCSAVEGQWCVFGCMLSAGGAFQWLRNTLGQSEIAEAQKQGRDPYALLIDQAAQARPGCDGLFFLPYLTGERCPHPNPNARGGWIGLTARHQRSAIIRALLEGVTFGMGDILQIMDGMGVSIETVRLSGGGARSDFWRQLQADVYGKTVATINSDEGPAYGVAILAGVGTGVWDSVPQACQSIIHETEQREPDSTQHQDYARRHRQYQRLYAALKDEFDAIAALD
jgi:xylulokinase